MRVRDPSGTVRGAMRQVKNEDRMPNPPNGSWGIVKAQPTRQMNHS